MDQMAAVRGFSAERSDPAFVNINQQQSSNLTQQDVFHKSRAKCLRSLLHAKLPVPEPEVKSYPGCIEFNNNTSIDFSGSRFSLSEATGVLKHCFWHTEKSNNNFIYLLSFYSNSGHRSIYFLRINYSLFTFP